MLTYKKQYRTIDEYIKTCPKDTQTILKKIKQTIQKVVRGAEETISYQMPTFKLSGKNLVHFAAWKNHIGFYPTPNGLKEFQKELSLYKGAKGSVQFPLTKPIPYNLIKRIVLFRVKETWGKKSIRTGKILTKHPQGKSGKNITKQSYEILKKAILVVLRNKALMHAELFKQLNKKLKGKFLGNIDWYAETVKLDLEARKIIKRTDSWPQKYQLK